MLTSKRRRVRRTKRHVCDDCNAVMEEGETHCWEVRSALIRGRTSVRLFTIDRRSCAHCREKIHRWLRKGLLRVVFEEADPVK